MEFFGVCHCRDKMTLQWRHNDVIITSLTFFDVISLVVTRGHSWSLVVTCDHSWALFDPIALISYVWFLLWTTLCSTTNTTYMIHGTAKLETDALSRAPYQPHTWWHHMNDIFMTWTHSVGDLHAFTPYLNSIHTTIKFTSNYTFPFPFLMLRIFSITAISQLTLTLEPFTTYWKTWKSASSCYIPFFI